MLRIPAALALALLAGCTAYTPYPGISPLYDYGASVNANRAPRGSRAFCETYARQSAANYYEANRNRDATDLAEYAYGRRVGARAYQRCLSGRLN